MRLKASIVYTPASDKARRNRAGLSAGLAALGIAEVGISSADFIIVWGERLRRSVLRYKKPVLVMEHGYLGERFDWCSLGWDGLNGRANFCNNDVPDDRWRKYWRDSMLEPTDGDYALIIGQVAGDMATVGCDLYSWIRKVRQELPNSIYRAHPNALRRGQAQPVEHDTRPLDVAFMECSRVITWNSNTGVLAAMAGKRVTVEDNGAMAWEVAGHGWMDDRPLGNRDEWGRKLAYCQWLPEEIAHGDYWETLKCRFS